MMTSFDEREFRTILGLFPTGVVVVSTMLDGRPEGMTIGAFTSVSLDPPLVGFLPAKTSGTWPKIRAAGKFTINILGHDQEHICRAFGRPSVQKYEGLDWTLSAHNTPHIGGSIAWLDCTMYQEFEAGDHDIAIGKVEVMTKGADRAPLIFFGGGYHTVTQTHSEGV